LYQVLPVAVAFAGLISELAYNARRELAKTIAACVSRGRKVRAPQGRVPGNAWGARAYDQCNREQTADGPAFFEKQGSGKGERVR